MKFFPCDCSTHVLGVDRFDVELDEKEKMVFPDIELTIWQQPSSGIYTIGERLRHIWQIIRWGHPYGDFVIIGLDESKKLRDYISELIREWETQDCKDAKPKKTINEVLSEMEDELKELRDGYLRWEHNAERGSLPLSLFTTKDCHEMMNYYRSQYEIVERHIELVEKLVK